jgi:ankyrin repeat protein
LSGLVAVLGKHLTHKQEISLMQTPFKFFVSKGADVNVKDSDGVTLIQLVARDSEVAKFLVSKGAVPVPASTEPPAPVE